MRTSLEILAFRRPICIRKFIQAYLGEVPDVEITILDEPLFEAGDFEIDLQ